MAVSGVPVTGSPITDAAGVVALAFTTVAALGLAEVAGVDGLALATLADADGLVI